MGTLDEAGERLRAFEQAGVQRVMLQDFIPRDLDMIRLMGRLGRLSRAPERAATDPRRHLQYTPRIGRPPGVVAARGTL